jgi:hypothetical protein
MNAEASAKGPSHVPDPGTLLHEPELAAEYRGLVFEEWGVETVVLGCVVTRSYVFDFLIFYESLLNSWTFYPFQVHVFAADRECYDVLSELRLPDVEVQFLPSDSTGRRENAVHRVRLVEESGLDRCIVTDVDVVFVAETPELFTLLDHYDFVFTGSPAPAWPIQGGLWSFKKNARSVEFSRRWYQRALASNTNEMSGLPFALLHDRPEGLAVKVLARPKPESNKSYVLSPYCVLTNMRPFSLSSDPLGFREKEMGRAKVMHLGAMNAKGSDSLASRIDVVCERFPESAPFLPLYVTLATRAAERLGIESLPDPFAYLRERLEGSGQTRRDE